MMLVKFYRNTGASILVAEVAPEYPLPSLHGARVQLAVSGTMCYGWVDQIEYEFTLEQPIVSIWLRNVQQGRFPQ